MKPIILICGAPHSYTSMVSNFLIDNGGYCDDLWDDPKFDMPYSRFESKEIQDFARKRKNFKKKDLTDFFNSLPPDKVVTLKYPLLIYFINELSDYTNRPIKVIYVFRNPQDIILSSMEKTQRSFIYHFERLAWLYNFMVNSRFPVFPLISERLILKDEETARALLTYCELSSEKINFSSIKKDHVTFRKPTYLKYRFANFVWKRLSFLFTVFKKEENIDA